MPSPDSAPRLFWLAAIAASAVACVEPPSPGSGPAPDRMDMSMALADMRAPAPTPVEDAGHEDGGPDLMSSSGEDMGQGRDQGADLGSARDMGPGCPASVEEACRARDCDEIVQVCQGAGERDVTCPCAFELAYEGAGVWEEVGEGEYALETELGLGGQLVGRRCNEHNDDMGTSCQSCEALELEVVSGAPEKVLMPDAGVAASPAIVTLALEQPLRLLGPTPTQPSSNIRSAIGLEARCMKGGRAVAEAKAQALQLVVQPALGRTSELWLRADAGVSWGAMGRVDAWYPVEGRQAPEQLTRVHPDQGVRWEAEAVGGLPAVRFDDPGQSRLGGLEADELSWYLNSEQGAAQGMTVFFVADNDVPRSDRGVLMSNCDSQGVSLEMGGGIFQIGFGGGGSPSEPATEHVSLWSHPPGEVEGFTQYAIPARDGFRLLAWTLDTSAGTWSLHVDGASVPAESAGVLPRASTGRWNVRRLFGTCAQGEDVEFQGRVAEVLVWGEPLTVTEREQVEAYLRLKYQLGEP